MTTLEALGPAFEGAPVRAFYPDLPGHGDAPALPEATSEAVLGAVVSFIEEQLQEPVLLAGCSYGGYLASAVARRRPELVLGLLLVCPGVRRERDLPDAPQVPQDTDWLDTAPRTLHEHLERAVGHRTRAVVQRVLGALDAGGPGDEDYQEALRGGDGYFLADEDESTVFDRPVVVVTGRQDRIVGFADQFRQMTAYPRGTFVVADLAGHYLPYERPEVLRSASREWVERCGAASRAARPITSDRGGRGTPAPAAERPLLVAVCCARGALRMNSPAMPCAACRSATVTAWCDLDRCRPLP